VIRLAALLVCLLLVPGVLPAQGGRAPAPAPPALEIAAPNPKLAAHLRRQVAEIHRRLRALTGAAPRRIRIEVPPDAASFQLRAHRLGGPAWAAGLALPARGIILLRAPSQFSNPAGFDLTLAHELTHLYLAAALGSRRVPLWLEEGLAMHAAGEGGWGRAGRLAGAVLQKRLIPFAELARRFPGQSGKAALAYAQSYYLVGYLVNRYGEKAVARLLAEVARGRAFTSALRLVTGKGLVALEREFAQEMRSRFSWMALALAAGTLWALVALGAGIGLVLRRRQQVRGLRAGGDDTPRGHQRWRRWPPPPRPRLNHLRHGRRPPPPAGRDRF